MTHYTLLTENVVTLFYKLQVSHITWYFVTQTKPGFNSSTSTCVEKENRASSEAIGIY